MKTSDKSKTLSGRIQSKTLTLGDLIASTYGACGEQRAPKILQLALETHMVRLAKLS